MFPMLHLIKRIIKSLNVEYIYLLHDFPNVMVKHYDLH